MRSTLRPPAPSESSGQNNQDLSTFLSNLDYRKLYNKSLNFTKKYQNLRAKNWFLEKCVSETLIPNDFKIRNKSNESTIKASVEWIRIAIKDNLEEEKKLLENITEFIYLQNIQVP